MRYMNAIGVTSETRKSFTGREYVQNRTHPLPASREWRPRTPFDRAKHEILDRSKRPAVDPMPLLHASCTAIKAATSALQDKYQFQAGQGQTRTRARKEKRPATKCRPSPSRTEGLLDEQHLPVGGQWPKLVRREDLDPIAD